MKRLFQIFLIGVLLVPGTLVAQGKQIEAPPAQSMPPRKLYLPIMAKLGFAITGRITDEQGQPIAAVTVNDQFGHTASTDQNGYYTLNGLSAGSYALAPSKAGFVFSPAVNQVEVNGAAGSQNFLGFPACPQALVNGGFENVQGWQLSDAYFTTAVAHTGGRSLLAGITTGAENRQGYSFAVQEVTLPAGAASALLRLWLYPISQDAVATGMIEQEFMPDIDTAAASSDAQYVLVRNSNGDLLETLLWMRSNERDWRYYEFNLSKYAGQTIKLEVGVFNDGYEGVTAVYADDLALELCAFNPAMPLLPTQTCENYFGNSNFEVNGSWVIQPTKYPAGYSTYVNHTPAGTRSMRTGIIYTRADVFSYSDFYQQVTIPANAESANLRFWVYRLTEEPEAVAATLRLPEAGTSWTDAPLDGDLQYVLVLDTSGNILKWLTKADSAELPGGLPSRVNDPTWRQVGFNLMEFAGRTIRIQFGTFNNGPVNNVKRVTTMFIDDAVLDICLPEVTPTSPPPPTPTPLPTATPPPPGVCSEKFENNSFETNSDWGIPITAFSAGYSTRNFHTGARSMRTGIIYTAHNRFSYSDAYQVSPIKGLATSATLGMWVYPISERAVDRDVQYVLVLDRYGNWIDTLLWQRSNSQVWTYYTWDLMRYAGTTIRVQFGVYNDGLGDVTTMYVDDVTLQVCP